MGASAVIERVESIPFSLPLAQASRWGRWGARDAQDHVLVRITDSDGVQGIAEATPRPTIYGETQTSVHRAIVDLLAPHLVGTNPNHRLVSLDRLRSIPWNLTARAAIDIAIHDLLARRCGLALAEFLGGSVAPIPITYMLSVRTIEETIEEALRISDTHGIRSFKVKLGGDARKDRAVLEALRTDGHPDWTLTIDGNELYDAETLMLLPAVVDGLRIALVEDPYRHTGLRAPRPSVVIGAPIMADEHITTPESAMRVAADPTISTICIKPPRTGVADSLAIRSIADAAGVTIWIGSQGISQVGALASAHLSTVLMTSRVPADLGTFLRQAPDATLLSTPLELVDGCIPLSDAPGLGAEISEEALERFGVDR